MSAIAALYVRYIISGHKSFSDVPKMLRPQVAEVLRDMEMEHLITED